MIMPLNHHIESKKSHQKWPLLHHNNIKLKLKLKLNVNFHSDMKPIGLSITGVNDDLPPPPLLKKTIKLKLCKPSLEPSINDLLLGREVRKKRYGSNHSTLQNPNPYRKQPKS